MEKRKVICKHCSETIDATIIIQAEADEHQKKYGMTFENVFVQTDDGSLPDIYCPDCRSKLTRDILDKSEPPERTQDEILKDAASLMDDEEFRRGYVIGVELGQKIGK